jgi:hypothetical protein
MRRDGLCRARAAAFRASAQAVRAWEREHPMGLAELLDWIDALRARFGEPRVDRRPWRGSDFRL